MIDRAIRPPLTILLTGLIVFLLQPHPVVSAVAVFVAVFGAVDSYGRYRDYQYLSAMPYITLRLATYYGKSYCGRSVVIGCTNVYSFTWREYFYYKGYRWYHFLPDGFPSMIFKPAFWRNLATGHQHAR